MPELPEVETVRRVLAPQLIGRRIQAITLARPEIIAHPTAEAFRAQLVGQRFADLARRGKFLVLCMARGARVVLHLRMTGSLLVAPSAHPPEAHTHITFHLSDGMQLRFADPRRFGRFWLLQGGEPDRYSGIETLGPEPFDPCLTGSYLAAHLGNRKRAIKCCLLEQQLLAGVGNIYADELLFSARIHPARPAASLTTAEWQRLAQTIPQRLTFFIEQNAISPEEYLATKGRSYRNTPYLNVYGHSGEPCPVCSTRLCKTVLGGRSSVYCPHCQRLPKRARRA